MILANGDVEGAAQLVPELGGDKQTALGLVDHAEQHVQKLLHIFVFHL